ncbi:replication initiation protein [Persicobacter psychrovividus]
MSRIFMLDQEASTVDFYISKSNRIVQASRRYSLNLFQQRAFNKITELIREGKIIRKIDSGNDQVRSDVVVRLHIQDVIRSNRLGGTDYAKYVKSISDLPSFLLRMKQVLPDGTIKWSSVSAFPKILGEDDLKKKRSTVDIQVAGELIQHVIPNQSIEIGGYIQYKASRTFDLKHSYSHSLYEFLRSHAFKNKKNGVANAIFEINELAQILCPGSYQDRKKPKIEVHGMKIHPIKWVELNRRVLAPSVKDVNENINCDLSIEKYTPIKKGRAVSSVEFSFFLKGEGEHDPIYLEDTLCDHLIAKITGLTVFKSEKLLQDSRNRVQALIDQYPEERLRSNLDYMLAKKNIKLPMNYFEKAVMKDYANTKTVQQGQLTFGAPAQVQQEVAQESYVSRKTSENKEKAQLEAFKARKIAMEQAYNQWYEQVREQYLSSPDSLRLMTKYLRFLENEASAYERKFLQEWEAGTPSADANKWFGRYLVSQIGTPQEQEFLQKGVKFWARVNHDFNMDEM